MSSLNGSWIEIFRAGDYGERGRWTPEDLDRIAASYSSRLHPAPVVVGHPSNDAPAYGWIARLRRAGQSLWAQLEKVDQGFEQLLREGRFRQRSVALYKNFPPVGAPYLRHVGFLGAAAPAVKGLAPVRFAEAPLFEFTESIPDQQDGCPVGQTSLPVLPTPKLIPEAVMSESRLEKFFNHLRAFFSAEEPSASQLPAKGEEDLSAVALAEEEPVLANPSSPHVEGLSEDNLSEVARSASTEETRRNPGRASLAGGGEPLENFTEEAAPERARSFGGRGFCPDTKDARAQRFLGGGAGEPLPGSPEEELAGAVALAERLSQLEQRFEVLDDEKRAADDKLADEQDSVRKAETVNFVEALRARGQFPPVFDSLGVPEFLERLAAADAIFGGRGFPVLPVMPALSEAEGSLSRLSRAESREAQPREAEPRGAVEGNLAEKIAALAPPLAGQAATGPAFVGRGFNPAKSDAALAATEEGVRGNPSWVSPEQEAVRQPLLTWFQEFLTQLPQLIEFRELTEQPLAGAHVSRPAGRIVRFAEPCRGVEVDPASVELAERAESLAEEQGITYAEALAQLRPHHRHTKVSV